MILILFIFIYMSFKIRCYINRNTPTFRYKSHLYTTSYFGWKRKPATLPRTTISLVDTYVCSICRLLSLVYDLSCHFKELIRSMLCRYVVPKCLFDLIQIQSDSNIICQSSAISNLMVIKVQTVSAN